MNPGSLASHKKWADQNNFRFPICVDEEKKVAAAYGAVKPEGGIQRCVIIVDQKGQVSWAKEGLPETSEILAALDDMAHDDPDNSRLSSS